MTKSVYEILASKVIDAVEAIQDPVEKAKAIGKFMEILKDKDVEGVVTPVKVKAAKQQEEKAAAAEEEFVKEMDGTYNVKPKKAAKVEKPADVLNLPKSEPLEMVKPNKEKVEAIKAKIEEADVLTLPSENDTEETVKLRRSLLAKKYGDMTIEEAFGDPEVSQYLTVEIESMSAFKEQLMKCFEIEAVYNDDGAIEYISKGTVTIDQIDSLIHHYIHEADPKAEEYSKVKLDKFLTAFIPYMIHLYGIYSYTPDQIAEVGREAMDEKEDFSVADINIHNAEALLMVMEDKFNH